MQLHGATDEWDPFPEFLDELRAAGAEVVPIRVYRWRPAPRDGEFDQLVARHRRAQVRRGELHLGTRGRGDADARREMGIEDGVLTALRTDVHAMCVGPVTARPLVRLGVPTSAPERMRLGALARHITDELPLLRSRTVRVAGHRLEIRGTCVLVDGAVKSLSPAGMATIRAWPTGPARWCRGRDLLRALPGTRHRHPRGGDSGAAAANCVGRQEHRLDSGQAGLPAGRRRADWRGAHEPDLLVAHGTRKPGGVAMVGELAERVGDTLRPAVRVAFVDVLGPTPAEVLRALPDARRSVVPAFLASGYHVRVDIPAHVAASGHSDVTVTDALGPCPQHGAGAGHGSSNPVGALAIRWSWRQPAPRTRERSPTCARTAALLSAVIGDRVELAYAATGEPRVADAVPALRARGAPRGRGVLSVGRRTVPGPVARHRAPTSSPNHSARIRDGAADREPLPPRPPADLPAARHARRSTR